MRNATIIGGVALLLAAPALAAQVLAAPSLAVHVAAGPMLAAQMVAAPVLTVQVFYPPAQAAQAHSAPTLAAQVLDAPMIAPPGTAAPRLFVQQEARGDDIGRIRRWRSFLDRAHRAFFASHRSTTAVKAKIEEADQRIEELENAPADDPGGRSDITGDVAFLERAERAFTFAHMNTAAVKKWLEEAREDGG